MAKIGINIATGSLQQNEMIVGIDLGTTNSLVAIIHPGSGKPQVLRETDGSALVPSIVHFGANGQLSVGNEARSYLITDPSNTIFSVKRLMGKSYGDVSAHASYFSYRVIDDDTEGLVKIQVGEKFYSPVELSSFILSELKKRAEHILKTPVRKAVITVPAYFNDAQRQATRDAGKIAGLDVLRIINEPTAASLAYGLGMDRETSKTVAVYDLGGGTFDISILRIHQGIFEVLATNGDTYLGGDDFDRAIQQLWMRENNIPEEKLATDKPLSQLLRLKAEEAKIRLSGEQSFHEKEGAYQFQLSRERMNELFLPFVERTLRHCGNALNDAGLGIDDINEVVLVGGSTRVPLVKQMVGAFFAKTPQDSINPDEVVALGAAVQADILAGNNKDFLLLDITPLSLGIETFGGLMDVLIPRNSKIPTSASRQYTTQKDGQGSMRISVFQGERDLVRDNRKLAEFNLTGIPGMPAGLAKVEISFLINADGILVVKAKELRSGVEQSIEVKPQYGLSDEQVEQMLLDSITHAKEDMQTRAIVEARTEARQLVDTTRHFIEKNPGFLTETEVRDTDSALAELEKLMETGSKDEVQAGIEKLNNISRPYAERLMDQAVKQALKDKKI